MRKASIAALCALTMSAALLTPMAAAAADPGVNPSTLNLNLPPGGSTTIDKTVSTPPIPPNPDIVFLVDTTTSMGPVITNVQNNAASIIDDVQSAQPTAEFAVAEYKDEADADAGIAPFTVLQNLTGNESAVVNGIDNLTPLSGGGDDAPEDGINGLYQVATGAVAFRPNSARVVIWIGDSSSHDPSGGHSLGDAINALNAANAEVIALDVGPTPGEISDGLDNQGQATAVTNATGGHLYSGVHPDQVSSTILDGLHNLPVTVSYSLSGCDPDLNVSENPPSRTVTSGNDADFSEPISVSSGAVPGSALHCTVNFLLNGSSASGFSEAITEDVPKASPSISTTPSGSVPAGGAVSDSATVSGGYAPSGNVTFRLYGPGDTTCTTPIATRIDSVSSGADSGPVSIGGVGVYRWTADYSGDPHNNGASSGCGAETVTVIKATPTLATTPGGSVPAGTSTHDTATVGAGFNPTGSVTFNLYAPGDTTCSTVLQTATVPLSAAGVAESGELPVGPVGTYNWVATYNGDNNNNPVTGSCGDEPAVVVKATPTLSTTPSASVPAGGVVSDTASVTGGYLPTGTVTFRLYAPGDTTCATPIATRVAGLSGSGTAGSGGVTIGAAGTYNWVVTYSGDDNNNTVVGVCGAEPVLVTPQILTGRAYGLSANVTLAGIPLVTIKPTPDTGAVVTTHDSLVAPPCVASLTGLITTHALCARVATVAWPSVASGFASINDTSIGVAGIPAITLRAVQSTSATTCAGSAGATTIAYLKVGTVTVISQPTQIPANTTLNLGVVKLVLNEQHHFSAGGDSGLTVNAVHVTVNALGLAKVDAVVASSESDIGNCP